MALTRIFILILLTMLMQTTFVKPQDMFAREQMNDMFESYNSSVNLLSWGTEITRVFEGITFPISVNITCRNCSEWSKIYFEVEDLRVARISSTYNYSTLTRIDGDLHVAVVNITGIFIGMTSLHATLMPSDDVTETFEHQLFVARIPTMIDLVFNWLLTAFIVLANVTFGCELDLQELKKCFKRPFGILIGLFCQYGFMPAIAVGASILSGLDNTFAFGLLAYGCSPGGGASNVWAVLLGGDLNLSIAMTFSSFILSFAMMPLWLYTAGQQFSDDSTSIPFTDIVQYLSILLVPTVVGIIIRRIRVSIADAIVKYIRPLVIIVILGVVAMGFYLTRYIFTFMSRVGYQLVLPSLAVPYLGMLLSLITAFALRQSWTNAKTISIGAGIQEVSVALVLLRSSLPSPQSEISTVPPLIAVMLIVLPLFAALIGRRACIFLRGRFCPSPEEEEEEKEVQTNGIFNPSVTPDEEAKVTKVQSNTDYSEALAQTKL